MCKIKCSVALTEGTIHVECWGRHLFSASKIFFIICSLHFHKFQNWYMYIGLSNECSMRYCITNKLFSTLWHVYASKVWLWNYSLCVLTILSTCTAIHVLLGCCCARDCQCPHVVNLLSHLWHWNMHPLSSAFPRCRLHGKDAATKKIRCTFPFTCICITSHLVTIKSGYLLSQVLYWDSDELPVHAASETSASLCPCLQKI